MIKNYLWSLGLVVIASTLVIILAFYLWSKIWVRKLGVEIPIEKKINGLERKHLYYSTTSPSILTEFFQRIISRFDRSYWIENCGVDAYLYLLL